MKIFNQHLLIMLAGLFAGLFIYGEKSFSQPALTLIDDVNKYDTFDSLEILIDIDENLQIEDVIKKSSSFTTLENTSDFLKQINKVIWFKLSLNNFNSSKSSWVLSNISTQTPFFNVYRLDNNVVTKIGDYGFKVHFEEKGAYVTHPRVPIELKFGEEATFYIQTKFLLLPIAKMEIMLKNESLLEVGLSTSFGLFYFGFIFSLILYNLGLFFRLRDVAYLNYSFFAASMSVGYLIISGYFELFHFPQVLGRLWIEHTFPIFILITLSGSLFSQTFLKLKELAPKLNSLINFLNLSYFVIFIYLLLVSVENVVALVTVVNSVGFIISIVGGIVAYKRGFKAAKIFLAGWGSFLFFYVLWQVGQTDLYAISLININYPAIGNMVEMSVMSFALAQRIKALQDNAIYAKAKIKEGESNRRLLRVVCHDLVSPLSVISGYALMSLECTKDEQMIKYNNRITKASNMMTEILTSVRRMESQSSGKRVLELEPVLISEVYDDLKFIFESRLKDKSLYMTLDFKNCEPNVFVLAEKISFTHDVLANIISNSIKFSPEGAEIKINIEVRGEEVVISVVDRGIGIPENLITSIFDPFKQTSRPGTKGEVGTGFGMPLAKSFIDAFSGSIHINSTCVTVDPINQGTEFQMTFVLAHKEDVLEEKETA